MNIRRMFRAQVKGGARDAFLQALEPSVPSWGQELRRQGLRKGALFEKNGILFFYFEAVEEAGAEPFRWEWPEVCRESLEVWPGDPMGSVGTNGKRLAVPLLDIFHDGAPDAQLGRKPVAALARLKPEMYGSYVFYHYALQEEKPNSFNPTYTIGSHEDLIFSYHELPAPTGTDTATRRAWPAPVAPDNWYELMEPHFVPWPAENQELVLWDNMPLLFLF